MELLTVLGLGIALGMDAFSVAVACGLNGIGVRAAVGTALTVAGFHVFMPLLGLVIGQAVGGVIGDAGRLIGAGVLLLIGLEMVVQAARHGRQVRFGLSEYPGGVFSGVVQGPLAVLFLAGSVSVDALSVGFGLGALRFTLAPAVLIVGVITGTMFLAGCFVGLRAGSWLSSRGRYIGGIIIIVIAAKMAFGL